jgi:GTPase SAR1 family protein
MIEFLDTASYEQFTMRDMYIKSSEGFYVVFPLNRPNDFAALQEILDRVAYLKEEPSPMVLVGSMCDLERAVTREEAEQFADKFGILYFETSAKLNINVHESFNALTQLMIYKDGITFALNSLLKNPNSRQAKLDNLHAKNASSLKISFSLIAHSANTQKSSLFARQWSVSYAWTSCRLNRFRKNRCKRRLCSSSHKAAL